MEHNQFYQEDLPFPLTAPSLYLQEEETSAEIYIYMEIQSPIETLKTILEGKTGKCLKSYSVWLQNIQTLEPNKTLVDQCVKGEGIVQINLEIDDSAQKINITDVVKPTDEALMELEQQTIENDSDPMICEASSNDSIENDVNPKKDAESNVENVVSSQDTLNWVVDTSEKRRLNIPNDPRDWKRHHIQSWLQWAAKQFNVTINMNDWNMTGEELCELTMQDFKVKVPSDTGNRFWTHFELLRQFQLITIPGAPKTIDADEVKSETSKPKSAIGMKTSKVVFNRIPVNAITNLANETNQSNRSGNNGQIQLWQFLLEILTDSEHREIIQWLDDGEFKLTEPEKVAALWGLRKNKPTMNYEKLSRALRYYYDGDMISKVGGKRFVYKFVCDLKHLTGFSAQELSDRVNGRPRPPRERRFASSIC